MVHRAQRVALATLLLLAAAGAAAQSETRLSADGTQVVVAGRLSLPTGTGEGIAVLQLDVPATVVAHVANVIEPITSVERALQVRAASKDVARAITDAARAGNAATITGRLWWAGTTGAPTNYLIDAVNITSR